MKDLEGLYVRLMPRLLKVAYGMCGWDRELRDEFTGLIGLEFMKAVASHRPGRMPLEDWAALQLQNAIRDAKKIDGRRVKRELVTSRDISHEPPSEDIWLDLSEDAALVARHLLSYHGKDGKGVDSIKSEVYRLMSWRRFWSAVAEIKTYLGAEPC